MDEERIVILLSPELKERLKELAHKDRRSLSAFCATQLEKVAVEAEEVGECSQ